MRMILREHRCRAHLTQKEMAESIGISERHYRSIELGTQSPNVETAIKIARVLRETVEELFWFPHNGN